MILSQVITRDPTGPRKLNPSVPRELDTICLNCVEKSPVARYDTAQDLAADLRRFVDDLPIVAQPPGLLTRSIKFVRRHRTKAVAAVAAVLLTLLGLYAVQQLNESTRLAKQQVRSDVEQHLATASRAVEEQRYERAEAALEAVLELDPSNARAMFMQA